MIVHQLKKSKQLALFFLMISSMFSCVKDTGVSDAEQSLIDDKILLEYLSTHKLDFTGTQPDNHIDWKIVEAVDGDKETLADIAVKDSNTTAGVLYKYYFIEIEEGKNVEVESKDLVIVDFNEYLLDGTRLSTSENDADALKLELKSRISGVRAGLKYFFTGVIPDTNINPNYRKDTETPGRGILLLPSGLGYKDIGNDKIAPNQPLIVDLVLYKKVDFPKEKSNL